MYAQIKQSLFYFNCMISGIKISVLINRPIRIDIHTPIMPFSFLNLSIGNDTHMYPVYTWLVQLLYAHCSTLVGFKNKMFHYDLIFWFWWGYLPLSTIFQFYYEGQFNGGGNRSCCKSLINFIT